MSLKAWAARSGMASGERTSHCIPDGRVTTAMGKAMEGGSGRIQTLPDPEPRWAVAIWGGAIWNPIAWSQLLRASSFVGLAAQSSRKTRMTNIVVWSVSRVMSRAGAGEAGTCDMLLPDAQTTSRPLASHNDAAQDFRTPASSGPSMRPWITGWGWSQSVCLPRLSPDAAFYATCWRNNSGTSLGASALSVAPSPDP